MRKRMFGYPEARQTYDPYLIGDRFAKPVSCECSICDS